MARSTQSPVREAPVQMEMIPPAAPETPEEVPMYRYVHPIPPACAGCGYRCGGGGSDNAALLEALEQQNRLLTELLGAVTGLTAACLCRPRGE